MWQAEPGDILVSEPDWFRLIAERISGWVRYQVVRRGKQTGPGSQVFLASGSKDGFRATMDVAETVALHAGAGRRRPAGEQAA